VFILVVYSVKQIDLVDSLILTTKHARGNSMKRKWIATWAMLVVFLGAGTISSAYGDAENREVRNGSIPIDHRLESQFPDLAKIDYIEAVRAALTECKGKVLKVELENENGFLVYSVDLVTLGNSIMDVKVDAGSGAVLAMDRDQIEHYKNNHDRDSERHEEREEVE
jgi:uncharacterized membrane protein YkoI